MPPVCTLTCARAMRRSVAAVSIVPAISGVSQNAWMVMRGIGRVSASAGRRLVPLRGDVISEVCHRSVASDAVARSERCRLGHPVPDCRGRRRSAMTLARRAPLAGAIGCGRMRSAGLATIAARFCCGRSRSCNASLIAEVGVDSSRPDPAARHHRLHPQIGEAQGRDLGMVTNHIRRDLDIACAARRRAPARSGWRGRSRPPRPRSPSRSAPGW